MPLDAILIRLELDMDRKRTEMLAHNRVRSHQKESIYDPEDEVCGCLLHCG